MFLLLSVLVSSRLPQFYSSRKANNNKKGLAWFPENPVSWKSAFANTGVSWYYNWMIWQQLDPTNMEYVVNVHDKGQVDQVSSTIKDDSIVIGFNEPDLDGNVCGSPQDCANYYKQYLTPLRKSGKISRLSTPAISNVGLDWLQQFMNSCSDCAIDFVVVHCYTLSYDYFASFMNDARNRFGKNVWLTEFGYTSFDPNNLPNYNDVRSFMEKTLSFLDSTSWVERYAWFGAHNDLGVVGNANRLIDDNGQLTDLGRFYVQ
ncbi:hypothetical protein TRFO_43244 [Tritrichomonas foetus]|uniref:Asl1-like glycosyl hydrolase catalytic domain-containing protein n=1 Tax=Tritrichomonas foetus TaxID=1144522 RepID=A0A1J4KRA8_9EUKA|nr:hypothetical protein TRFO_43244 [Tritrichomonas foetus]|eukprot:OHT13807.1 hypothetical protein TRFO_43244 [Tritrichomonas foetus]